MSDLVEKMRQLHRLNRYQAGNDFREAADEIERLRARLAEARELIEYAYDEMGGKWPAADAFLAGEKP